MADKKEDASTPPVVAFKTMLNYWNSLAATGMVPSRIDKTILRSFSGSTQTQLLHGLRALGLINSDGVPQDVFKQFVKAEGADKQKILQGIMQATYPFLKDPHFHLNSATPGQLTEQFEKIANGDTVRKCRGFFVAAAVYAGFPVSTFITEATRNSPTKSGAKPKKSKGAGSQGGVPPPPLPSGGATSATSWNEMLLAKFPTFDPGWPDEVKKQWFASFKELMQQGAAKEDA